ncbi:MAG TPA: lipase maturation factor family protein [Candidatus Dormibacteraeota bacterium]|nr:lipase maturation factor family protein [Candidatus Dormibacteraeota bacterium]
MAAAMEYRPAKLARFLLGPSSGYLVVRWIFLRALGLIYFSAFFSLAFQIRGLIGPRGILPAGGYLAAVAKALGGLRFWYAPTLLWTGSGNQALELLCWAGMAASILAIVNFWPRLSFLGCLILYLSFVAAAQDFANYQSDGMLLAAGLLALFFAPPGWWPGWGADHPPSRASLYLLRWEWFRIYFESGFAKMAAHDPEWRNFTAMDRYYQNGPLPTWIGWYAQHLPHWFQAATVALILAVELGLAWLLFLPRRFRISLFFVTTAVQIVIILTANYAFLNYLVLAEGFLLLDDRVLGCLLPKRLLSRQAPAAAAVTTQTPAVLSLGLEPAQAGTPVPAPAAQGAARSRGWRNWLATGKLWLSGIVLGWIFYATVALFIGGALPLWPATVLSPFRFANLYGLFAVMTRNRYEIEFQGSGDGKTWVAYPFRYKPQDPSSPPGIYAPYQPRFDWNLWFASLGPWQESPFVLQVEERLLENDPYVLDLFAGNPFAGKPPSEVRAMLWQYWFTTRATKRATGRWWRRKLIGLYAPVIDRQPHGKFASFKCPAG